MNDAARRTRGEYRHAGLLYIYWINTLNQKELAEDYAARKQKIETH
jgi:hypothetical protein